MINSGLVWLANHLWQSTLFAMAVGCLTFVLRKNGARVRYLLWLAASCKFLVPFALLTAVGAQIPWPRDQAHAPHIMLSAGQIAVPFTHFGAASAPSLVAHAQSGEFIPLVLGAIWILGTLAVLARGVARWTLIHRALQESRPTNHVFVIPVRSTASQLEPAVVGILRPVLLLPNGLDQRLAPDEIRTVLAHERCHVAWKDNLAAALHMLVEALFWFHPLIWWLGARLVDERERACDEQVLADGHSPTTYAEGILKVCEHFLKSRLPCVAGVSGANLSQRIEVIMKNRLIEKLDHVRKLLIVVSAGAAIIAPVAVGVLTSPRARAQAGASDTEKPIISIQLSPTDGTYTPNLAPNPARWHMSIHVPLRGLIAQAYGVSPSQVVGRNWSMDPIYDITEDGPKSWATREPQAIMRDLLSKRFGLIVRVEQKKLPGYVLLIGASGSKLKPHSDGAPPGGHTFSPNSLEMTNSRLSNLVAYLQGNPILGAPIIDQTGLQGNYDYKVTWDQWSPDAVSNALEEQLGLRLEARTVNADIINVVSVKSPEEVTTANTMPPTNVPVASQTQIAQPASTGVSSPAPSSAKLPASEQAVDLAPLAGNDLQHPKLRVMLGPEAQLKFHADNVSQSPDGIEILEGHVRIEATFRVIRLSSGQVTTNDRRGAIIYAKKIVITPQPGGGSKLEIENGSLKFT